MASEAETLSSHAAFGLELEVKDLAVVISARLFEGYSTVDLE